MISVDVQKRSWWTPARPQVQHTSPIAVNAHAFPDRVVGKAIRYGVYNPVQNIGRVTVGTDHDRAKFSVVSGDG